MTDVTGKSPLYYAFRGGHSLIVNFLIINRAIPW